MYRLITGMSVLTLEVSVEGWGRGMFHGHRAVLCLLCSRGKRPIICRHLTLSHPAHKSTLNLYDIYIYTKTSGVIVDTHKYIECLLKYVCKSYYIAG